MRIVAIDGLRACCEAAGIERDVDLWLMQQESLEPGDYVLVHVGYAIQKVDAETARAAHLLYDSAREA